MSEREQLEQAIAALEAQRALLGDAVVNAALAPMREKLAALRVQVPVVEQQRKLVTVLFADVSGFTAMSETMDAEEVGETMNRLWERLDAAVVDHGGTIDKHIGDAVMALWGAQAAREDDPERAIRAALTMQSELRTFAAEERHPLRMRIGINTGPVLLGAVGSNAEYTAMGDTVNLASRLEHAAPVGGILISHDTYRHVRGVFEVLPLDPISVRGKAEPIQVYEVRGTRPRAFRVPTRGVEGIETRTIGREAELQRMQAAVEGADRSAHMVTIVGEAGVGKSRLLYEFLNWLALRPRPPQIFQGRATQEMSGLPYALIRDLLAFRFDIQDSDRAILARTKLEQGMLAIMGEAGIETAHFIGHLIGFSFADSPHLRGLLDDARQIHDRAFHAFIRFFTAITAEAPAMLLLEDIHWADDGSLDLIAHLAQEGHDLPLLIVGLARPILFERRPSWGEGLAAFERIDLHPLSKDDTRRLVAEVLRNVPEIPHALQELIVSGAEGNPFYVEELIKMLIEDGVIVTGADRWRIEPRRLAEVRVPPTLTGVLQARLDGLPPPERSALQQASIVGRVFWDEVLEYLRTADKAAPLQPDLVANETLRSLWRKELIFRHEDSAFAQTHEYIFKHAILRDVTYESVLRRMRRIYHARVAAWLIERSGERVGEYAGLIGEHYERAGERLKAAEWYAQAGRQAHTTYAPEAAIDYYRKALAFWEEADATAYIHRQIEVYEGLGEMLHWRALNAEAVEAYTQMRLRAEAAGDLLAQARAWNGLFLAYQYQGDHRAALESTTRAEELARAAADTGELATALCNRGQILFRLGHAEAALELGERVLEISAELGSRRKMARSLNLLGAVHNMLGQYEQAAHFFGQALLIFRERRDRRSVAALLNNLGVIAEERGDAHAAFTCYHDALTIAREIGNRDGELVYLSNLGGARVRLGEYPEAEADLRQVIQIVGTTDTGGLADTYCFLTEACLGQGKFDEALAAAREALSRGQHMGVQAFIAAAWRVLGMVAAQLPEPISIEEEAQLRFYDAPACFAESVRICLETGMEGERAQALRAWAHYELTRGDHERGAARWYQAREIFAQLGVRLKVEQMAELPA